MQCLMKLNKVLKKYREYLFKRKTIKEKLKQVNERIEKVKKQLDNDETAIIILKEYLSEVTEEVVTLFEQTISAGLKRIFNEEYEFKLKIETGKRGGKCEFLIHTDEYEDFLPLAYTQGTLLNQIISVLCRIIIVSLDPKLHKTIILDEPLNGMSDEKVNVVTELLVDVCKDFGLQMIMVTHHRQMADYADKVFIL